MVSMLFYADMGTMEHHSEVTLKETLWNSAILLIKAYHNLPIQPIGARGDKRGFMSELRQARGESLSRAITLVMESNCERP